MAALPLTVNFLHKSEMGYHGKNSHTLGKVQHISHMSRLDVYYSTYRLATQTMELNCPSLQGVKRRFQYLASHSHKLILYHYNYYDGSNVIRLTWSGNQF